MIYAPCRSTHGRRRSAFSGALAASRIRAALLCVARLDYLFVQPRRRYRFDLCVTGRIGQKMEFGSLHVMMINTDDTHRSVRTQHETDNKQLALQALAQGAQDYLVKGQLTPELLSRALRYAIERGRILKQLQTEVQERQRSEQTLRLIVEGTASVTGKDFFHSLVRSLAEALEARYAFITECIEDCPGYLRAIAFWQGKEFGEGFEYDVHGTPCEQVINSRGCQCYPNGLQSLFPEEADLVMMEAVSYSGIALLDTAGELMGHLAVLDDKPMETEPRNTALLEIFAARAAAEMERLRAEEAMRISQEKFSTAFRSSPSGISISTLNNGRYIEVNDSYLRMLGYSRSELIGKSALELGIWVKAEDRATMSQLLQTQRAVSNLEIEFRKKSGQTFLGLVSAEVVDLGDEPCLLAITTDITVQRKRLHRELAVFQFRGLIQNLAAYRCEVTVSLRV
ncbi:PAS domain-containing protein [Leptolyngbya sp. 7M]|uniref:PAS domain-containing protein n=1 Tax=Leptolyngbya sp. 7M TaxID=2812896 RepID=UPI001B8C5271|nr:PAS domain S-box protein [Leptolyngbya sp. 7M]QYO65180.1 PAS domain-containing protein [Leptolyngbya sp. 7M]